MFFKKEGKLEQKNRDRVYYHKLYLYSKVASVRLEKMRWVGTRQMKLFTTS